MTRITELPEVSVLADDDFVTCVDVSDMSESPTGKNVKIQKSNLVSGVYSAVGKLAGNFTLPDAVTTVIPFDTWAGNQGSRMTVDANGRVTFNEAGLYICTYNIELTLSVASDEQIIGAIRHVNSGDTQITTAGASTRTTYGNRVATSLTLIASVGDYVEATGYMNYTSDTTVNASKTNFGVIAL